MRIYPDPELPDIEVEWGAEICEAATERVAVTLSTVAPVAEAAAVEVPCSDARTTFADVARTRYAGVARRENAAGTVLAAQTFEVDLRDGISKRIWPFLGTFPTDRFRVAWSFAMGASCAALSATTVRLRVSDPDVGPLFEGIAPCTASMYFGPLSSAGTYTVSAAAHAATGVVAGSPESVPVVVVGGGPPADFGTLTLTPCGPACPAQ